MHTSFRTYQMAKEFYRDCQKLQLKGAPRSQFERAILSIPLNLHEGASRPSRRKRRRFYYIALGSLREMQTLLELFCSAELCRKADVLGAHLYRLCQGC